MGRFGFTLNRKLLCPECAYQGAGLRKSTHQQTDRPTVKQLGAKISSSGLALNLQRLWWVRVSEIRDSYSSRIEPAMVELQKTHQIALRLLSGLEEDRFGLDYVDQISEFIGCFPEHGELG